MKKELEPLIFDSRKDTTGSSFSRRSFFVAAGAAGLGAAATMLDTRPTAAQSTDWTQPGNNNHVIEIQGNKGFVEGPVKFDYYGHCAFKITSPGGASVLLDPWRDDPSGAWGLWFKMKFPETVVDITMSTHTHFDHDAIDRPVSTIVLDRMAGHFEIADLKITGFADKHACLAPGWYKWTNALKEFGVQACPPDNVGHMDMVTYLIETGGVRTLIWGDNRPDPADAFWEAVGRVDVLTIPVDGSQHILSFAQAETIIDRLKPKVVIPTHYLNETTTYTLSTLQPADDWVKGKKGFKLLDSPSLSLAAKDIALLDREVFYFGNHAATS